MGGVECVDGDVGGDMIVEEIDVIEVVVVDEDME